MALAAALVGALAAPAAVAHADSTLAGRRGGVSDFSGDGFADVLGIDAGGVLRYYPNNGLRLGGYEVKGSSWSSFRHVKAADISGDGFADVLGVDTNGNLYYYPQTAGRLDGPIFVYHFYFTVRHFAVADWNADGLADLLTVDAANGTLGYSLNQGGRLEQDVHYITPLGFGLARHMVAADWSGDGYADVIASDSSGFLWYFPHEGNGLGAGQKIGTSGWQDFRFIRAMDFSGDGHADILGVNNLGNLYYYPHQGNGLGTAQLLGPGWGTFQNLL